MPVLQQHERRPERLCTEVSLANKGELKMAKRRTYHVTSDSNGACPVKAEGAACASSTHDNKADTVQNARNFAKAQTKGPIVIHRKYGQIQTEHTYGKDPHPPKG
ncbi:MAG: DUF2188 domain-containing protein [Phycisphaerae bacterium]